MIGVYVTFPSKGSAQKIARQLLQQRLIACVNYFPIESEYWWKGKCVREKEWAAFMKTRTSFFSKVVRYIEHEHPYETPCIEKISLQANAKYVRWVMSETRS